jgi:hypothetical protein
VSSRAFDDSIYTTKTVFGFRTKNLRCVCEQVCLVWTNCVLAFATVGCACTFYDGVGFGKGLSPRGAPNPDLLSYCDCEMGCSVWIFMMWMRVQLGVVAQNIDGGLYDP